MAFIPEIDGTSSNPAPTQRPAPPATQRPATVVKPKVASNPTGGYAKPVQRPAPVMDINTYLNQDAGYQQQLRELAKALSDFGSDLTRRRGDLTTGYESSLKALGDQKDLDLQAMQDDFGARGLLRSGLYTDAVGKYNTEYNNRVTDLGTQQNQALAALLQQQNQFQSSNDLQTQAAREAAIRRRAETLGV